MMSVCELPFILQRISVTNIYLSNNIYDINIACGGPAMDLLE